MKRLARAARNALAAVGMVLGATIFAACGLLVFIDPEDDDQ